MGSTDRLEPGSEAVTELRITELERAVAARDTFIAVAAHELRNPMMPILGQIDLLLSGVQSEKYSTEVILQRLERLQQTVRQYVKRAVVLLDVSRFNSGKFKLEPIDCDLTELIKQITDDFALTAQHAGATIETMLPPVVRGCWDRLAIEQIVENLLSNAIKYGGGTPVHLRIQLLTEEVQIHVRDHGKGIPPQHRARIFERFERAVGHNEYRSGFGVGLWVVGQLVNAMNGNISITDAPGGGALFVVTLPHCRLKDTP